MGNEGVQSTGRLGVVLHQRRKQCPELSHFQDSHDHEHIRLTSMPMDIDSAPSDFDMYVVESHHSQVAPVCQLDHQ